MRLTKFGLLFSYHGDQMLWRWPWARQTPGSETFYSSLYIRDFSNLQEYWKHVGILHASLLKTPDKIQAFTWIEILTIWVSQVYPAENLLILTNLEASAKGMSFWSRLPKDVVQDLLQDVVIFRCKDKSELFHLLDSIPSKFADAYAFSAGHFLDSNFSRGE
jgi:hypothetical protein